MIQFSIIMPTYNRAFCIQNAINSLLNQTYQNFELIIIDDGSTDNTEEFLREKYSKEIKNKKIIYIKLPKNKGVCNARNIGLKNANFEWIGYLDTDNTMVEDYLETFSNAINGNPNHKTFYAQMLVDSEKVIGKAFDYNSLLKANFIDMGVFVHHKSLTKKCGKFDTKLKRLVDWDLIIRYTKRNTPIFIKKVLLKYSNKQDYTRISTIESLNKAKNIIKKKIERSNMSFIQKIFSAKNNKETCHKVITICGLQLKFKSKKLKQEKELKIKANEQKIFEEIATIKSMIVKQTPQPSLKAIAVHLAEHCNLNCCGCDHFSPLAEKSFTDINQFKKDINRLAELSCQELGVLKLMGGEPLLHPNIIDFIHISREAFPNTRIEIVTNAIILNIQPDEFWQTCKNYDIIIVPTKYPIKTDYEKAEYLAKSKGVKYEYYGNFDKVIKTSYHIPLDVEGKQDAVTNFLNCFHANNCLFLKNGKLYTCTVAPNIEHFNKYFGYNIPLKENDGIDIYKAQTISNVLEFLAKPIPFCKYCNVKGRTFGHNWCISNKDIKEWT